MEIESYPSIYNLGHRVIENIFNGSVVVQEKVDGSQFSFAVFNGELFARSKGKQVYIEAPEKMFEKAVEKIISVKDKLKKNLIYRCEYLQKPKHNALAYSRVPEGNLVLFDLQEPGSQTFLDYGCIVEEAEKIGIESIPEFYIGEVKTIDFFKDFLERESFLGTCKIEGVVVKNYNLFLDDKKVAMGKYVSEAFKEKHKTEWKKSNPGGKDIIQNLIEIYRHENRWQKAVQHLGEKGELEGSPRDIPKLLKEVQEDILKEEKEEILRALFKWGWPQIGRGSVAGIAEWYKGKLLENNFGGNND